MGLLTPMPEPARILVTGSRAWKDYNRLAYELGYAIALTARKMEDVVFVHGAASSGADALTQTVCDARGWKTEPHPADWDTCQPSCKPKHRRTRYNGTTYCPAAGNFRNQAMVDRGASLGVAFLAPCTSKSCKRPQPHVSHGTADCLERLGRAGIPVRIVAEGVATDMCGNLDLEAG